MKKGDFVYVRHNGICYAHVDTIGCEGVVCDVLPHPYVSKVAVLFSEAIGGQNEWLYDVDELVLADFIPIAGSKRNYK